MSSSINTDAGRLFEAGFMVGTVRELTRLPQPPAALLALYQAQCATYHLDQVLDRFAKHGDASRDGRERARLLGHYYFFKGFMAGYTFLREYLAAFARRNGEGARTQKRTRQGIEVVYWQCSLAGKNRLESPTADEQQREREGWLAALPPPHEVLRADAETGGFLNADLLLLLRDGVSGGHALLVVDPSAFGPGEVMEHDFTRGSALFHLLRRDMRYLLEKGAFARLEMELGTTHQPLFTTSLKTYFSAFTGSDRESLKLIQAGSYADSFTAFLERNRVIPATSQMDYHIAGYADRGMALATLGPEDRAVLEACATIYQEGKGEYHNDAAREALVGYLMRGFQTLFAQGSIFGHAVQAAFDGANVGGSALGTQMVRVEHEETLVASSEATAAATTFQGITTALHPDILARCQLTPPAAGEAHVRWAHAELVHRALADQQRRYVFLTGNPGIGKTTALSDYIRTHCAEEGYLLLYASPRKTVNRDIFEKFRERDGAFADPRFVGLTTNSEVIERFGGQPVVYVGARAALPELAENGVTYLSEADLAQHPEQHARMPSRVKARTATTLGDTKLTRHGVIATLSQGIGAALSQNQEGTNHVVAALAVQAYKLRQGAGDTLDHFFGGIFRSAYLAKNAQVDGQVFIAEQMQHLAQTTRHLIFMIDEITGDEAGYAFFNRLAEELERLQLEQYGFVVKLVVADASLADQQVVQSHLHLGQTEPDARKIYIGPVDPEQLATRDPVTARTFDFSHPGAADAWLINTNAFPSSELHLRYAITVPLVTLPARMSLQQQRKVLSPRDLDDEVDGTIIDDVCAFLTAHPQGEQAIVYVQNKDRLGRIIEEIEAYQEARGEVFIAGTHFVEIHAETSEEQAALIRDARRRAGFQVIFMTSSASRGLSFAQARYLFIDVPRFQIETQLMEIIQVMYRGRGDPHDDHEKWITFYLSDRLFFREEETVEVRRARLREEQLDIITMLSLLKMSMLTRIAGAAPVFDRAYRVIPIGGKSTSGAGRAVHHDLAALYRAIQRDLRGSHRYDPTLQQLERTLEQLLDNVEITVPPAENSLLQLYEQVSPARLTEWMFSDAPLPDAFMLGSLIIVPVSGKQQTQAAHHMGLTRAIQLATSEATQHAIRTVFARQGHYAAAIHEHIRELDDLVQELQMVEHSQRLERVDMLADGYYVIPLAIFVAKEAIAAWCEEAQEEAATEVADALRNDLVNLVRSTYPIDTLLPVSAQYQRFPYLLITSRDLAALRRRMWQTGHVFSSREMNVLTMLLSQPRRESGGERP